MKYLFALLLLSSSIVKAGPCTEVFDQFIKHMVENNKTEAMKLVDPDSKLYREFLENRNQVFSSSVEQLRHHLMVFASFRMEAKDLKEGNCGVDMFGLNGPSRYSTAWGSIQSAKGKTQITSFGVMSLQAEQPIDQY